MIRLMWEAFKALWLKVPDPRYGRLLPEPAGLDMEGWPIYGRDPMPMSREWFG